MNVVFYQRDFSDKLKFKPEVKADRYSWHMNGGPKQATLTVPLTADRWEFIKLLRCPVEIYGPDGRLNWWGFVNRVAVPQGIQRFGYSLDSMFNHVIVRYGQDLLTEAATNAISIAEYGQKELVLRSYNSTGLEASQMRAVELQDRKNPKAEIEFSGGSEVIQIECLGWYDTLEWEHYTNATESNVSNTTQISTIAAAVGQFLNGVLIEDEAGVVSNQARDARDGLSCINELLQAGTSNNRPLLSRVDSNRYLHVFERSAQPPEGDVDYVMREDGRLETLAGGSLVPDAHCTVAKWVRAKGSPVEFSFFIESAEYNVENDKTTYRPAGGYEQRRLAKYIADVVTGDGAHVWSSLIPPNVDPQDFEPTWVALGKDKDIVTSIRSTAWDEVNNVLYVTGEFEEIGGVAAKDFAKLDMATGQWYALETDGAPKTPNGGYSVAVVGENVYFGVDDVDAFSATTFQMEDIGSTSIYENLPTTPFLTDMESYEGAFARTDYKDRGFRFVTTDSYAIKATVVFEIERTGTDGDALHIGGFGATGTWDEVVTGLSKTLVMNEVYIGASGETCDFFINISGGSGRSWTFTATYKVFIEFLSPGAGCLWEYNTSTKTWTDVSSGTPGTVHDMLVSGGTDLYFVGTFESMPSAATAKYAALYTGAAFTALAGLDWTGGGTGGAYGLATDGGSLYATGKIDGGYIAAWGGSTWAALGAGLDGIGFDVAYWNGYIVVVGQFAYIAAWGGSTWEVLGTLSVGGGLDAAATNGALATDGIYLYLVGEFASSIHSARWDGGEWVAMAEGLSGGTGFALSMFDSLHPVAGGDFTQAGNVRALCIAMYITSLEGLIDYLSDSGGTARPGGSDKDIQYNYDGRFGGEKKLKWDYENNNLLVGDGLTVEEVDALGLINKLILSGDGETRHLIQFLFGDNPPKIRSYYAKGTKASPTLPLDTNSIYERIVGEYKGSGAIDNAANWIDIGIMRVVATEDHTTTEKGVKWEFTFTPNGSTTQEVGLGVDENGLDMPERSTDAATPGAGRWRMFFKSDGLYYVEDDGTVVGPLATGGSWDGDITDIDETSSSDIGAAIADDDQGIIYDTSATAWVRFAWSRVKTYIQALTDTLYIATGGNVSQANMEMLADGSDADSLHTHDTLVSKQMLLGNCLNTTVPASSTYYAIPGTVLALQTLAYNTEITEACSISGLRINISNTQPASGSLVVTVQKNNVDTGITITIPADSPTGVYTESSPQTVAFAAGDLLIIKIQNNATSASASVTRHSLPATFT